jgi:uncharacterized protein (TIGR02118 family)
MEKIMMIKVTLFYPNEPGKKFDMDYYCNKHMPLTHQRLDPMGLMRSEVEKGVSDTDPNAPPRFLAVGSFYFDSVEQVHEAYRTHGRELLGDIKNYTDIQPQFLISEVVA